MAGEDTVVRVRSILLVAVLKKDFFYVKALGFSMRMRMSDGLRNHFDRFGMVFKCTRVSIFHTKNECCYYFKECSMFSHHYYLFILLVKH